MKRLYYVLYKRLFPLRFREKNLKYLMETEYLKRLREQSLKD